MAGSWLIASVCIDLMKHRSSATLAVCGSSSLTQAPLLPCWANLYLLGATGNARCVAVMPVSRWPLRTESGSSLPRRSLELRLVVEQIELRRGAGLEQVDDALGGRLGGLGPAGDVVAEQRSQRREADGPAEESSPAVERQGVGNRGGQRVHSLVTTSSRFRISRQTRRVRRQLRRDRGSRPPPTRRPSITSRGRGVCAVVRELPVERAAEDGSFRVGRGPGHDVAEGERQAVIRIRATRAAPARPARGRPRRR